MSTCHAPESGKLLRHGLQLPGELLPRQPSISSRRLSSGLAMGFVWTLAGTSGVARSRAAAATPLVLQLLRLLVFHLLQLLRGLQLSQRLELVRFRDLQLLGLVDTGVRLLRHYFGVVLPSIPSSGSPAVLTAPGLRPASRCSRHHHSSRLPACSTSHVGRLCPLRGVSVFSLTLEKETRLWTKRHDWAINLSIGQSSVPGPMLDVAMDCAGADVVRGIEHVAVVQVNVTVVEVWYIRVISYVNTFLTCFISSR